MIRFEKATVALGGRIVIHELSARVPAGRALAVIGLSGAGKTSLLAAAAAALPLHGGDIAVVGRSVRRTPADVRRLVGYAPSRPALWAAARVGDFLELAAVRAGLAGAGLRDAIAQALDRAGLDEAATRDRLDRLPDGVTKRLLVARAFLHDPEVLVLDDPFAGLDPPARAALERLIHEATFVGHAVVAAIDDAAVPPCFTHVAVLADGRIAAQGPARPDAFATGRRWRYRVVARGQAEAAAAALRPLDVEARRLDDDTLACRLDPDIVAPAQLLETLVRGRIAVESCAFAPPWTAQLLEP